MSKIDDFDEAEAELLKDGDAYEKEIKGKLERRMRNSGRSLGILPIKSWCWYRS